MARDPQSPAQTTDTPDFERALGELESLVERLERGDLPLEEALRTFERGVELTRQGLLHIDRRLPLFFEPEYQGVRYT